MFGYFEGWDIRLLYIDQQSYVSTVETFVLSQDLPLFALKSFFFNHRMQKCIGRLYKLRKGDGSYLPYIYNIYLPLFLGQTSHSFKQKILLCVLLKINLIVKRKYIILFHSKHENNSHSIKS